MMCIPIMFTTITAVICIVILCWIFFNPNILDWLCARIVHRATKYHDRRRPKRIILIRHGQSQGNTDTAVYATVPDNAIDLTEKGREQARNCGQELRKLIGSKEKLVCYVSPFRRSKATCELICEAFSPKQIRKIREDPRIREQEWGNFQDLATREITAAERNKIGRFFYRFRNGESGADAFDRVSSFMNSLFREMDSTHEPDSNVLIISHGLFMRLFLMRFYYWSVEKFHSLMNFDNCEYCILERNNPDGHYVLKTQLKIGLVHPIRKNEDSKERFNEESYRTEVNPSITLKHSIGTNEAQDDG